MPSFSARLLGIVVLLLVIAGPIAGSELIGSDLPAAVLAQDGSPVAGDTEQPVSSGEEPSVTPTDFLPDQAEPPTVTPSETSIDPIDSATVPALQTISATIDDPTTCVAGRSWWFSVSNAIGQEKNPAEITVTFVGLPSVTVPLDSPGSGAGFEAIYILTGNLDATLQSATAQVDAGVQFTFLLVKGPHCPGIPDEVASFTPTNTPANTPTVTNTPTQTLTPSSTPTITQTPRPTKQITAQLDTAVACGGDNYDWKLSITNPVSFAMNPQQISALLQDAGQQESYPDDNVNGDGVNGFTTTYTIFPLPSDGTITVATATVDAATDYVFKLVSGPKCSVSTATPTITPTPSLTPSLTPTLPAGYQYISAKLDREKPCQINNARWRFAIMNLGDEQANPDHIAITFNDGSAVAVARTETAREGGLLVSYYDWDQHLNGIVASATAMVPTDGTYLFMLTEGPNCFGTPTPTATSTPDTTCNSQNGQYTRICATIDLQTCTQYVFWVFALAPKYTPPDTPDSIIVNFVDGSSRTVGGRGQYQDGNLVWRQYIIQDFNAPQPGSAWAQVWKEGNDTWGNVFRLLKGPGCHGLGGEEPPTLTVTLSATRSPDAPSATVGLTRTPYPTDPAKTPTPPIGALPATGAGDSHSSAGWMTLLALASVIALGLAIRRRTPTS